jgi:hypothetical protein
MNKYHLVSIARPIYEQLVNYQTFSPIQITNAGYLCGFFPNTPEEKILVRNSVLNYFMMSRDVLVDNLKYTKPTPKELEKLEYIKKNINTIDLKDYIKHIDDNEIFNPNVPNAIDLVFTAADEPDLSDIIEEQKPLPDLEVKIEPFNEEKQKKSRTRKP